MEILFDSIIFIHYFDLISYDKRRLLKDKLICQHMKENHMKKCYKYTANTEDNI